MGAFGKARGEREVRGAQKLERRGRVCVRGPHGGDGALYECGLGEWGGVLTMAGAAVRPGPRSCCKRSSGAFEGQTGGALAAFCKLSHEPIRR